jgi:outer membrane protein assembly factor BamB
MKIDNRYLYIYSAGKVAKISKQNGEIIWQTKLRDVGSATVANVKIEDEKIFIGANGKLICIKEKDGELIWSNSLTGWGYNYIIFANQDQTNATINHQASQSADGASSVS